MNAFCCLGSSGRRAVDCEVEDNRKDSQSPALRGAICSSGAGGDSQLCMLKNNSYGSMTFYFGSDIFGGTWISPLQKFTDPTLNDSQMAENIYLCRQLTGAYPRNILL